MSSPVVSQSGNNASRLKNSIQQQKKLSSFDKSSNSDDCCSKSFSFGQKTLNKNEDSSVSHQPSFRDKMVAKQEVSLEPDVVHHENEEDFSYGPGFVSKLRYRYLSLTLRQTSVSKQRPSILELRRSTSLNNLLDEGSNDEEENENTELDGDVNVKERISETNNVAVKHENLKNHTRNGIDKQQQKQPLS